MSLPAWADNAVEDRHVVRLIMERIEIACETTVSSAVLRDMKIEQLTRLMGDEFGYRLRAYLSGAKPIVQSKERVQVPRTWWDHLKQRVASRLRAADLPYQWLRARVRTRSITITYLKQHICPHVNIAWPDRRHQTFLLYQEPSA